MKIFPLHSFITIEEAWPLARSFGVRIDRLVNRINLLEVQFYYIFKNKFKFRSRSPGGTSKFALSTNLRVFANPLPVG